MLLIKKELKIKRHFANVIYDFTVQLNLHPLINTDHNASVEVEASHPLLATDHDAPWGLQGRVLK